MQNGNIVFLNGVTSSGKSTLSMSLQAALDEPYYYVAADTFNEVICPFAASKGKFCSPEIMNNAISIMYLLIRDFSDKGLNVIVDHVMCEGNWLYECIDVLYEYPVMYVRVDCNRDELFRRAQARGYTEPDRLDQIDRQLGTMHLHNIHDIAINTYMNTVEENCLIIKRELENKSEWSAFKRLKHILDEERNNSNL